MNCYERLANEIILKAVADYRSYSKVLAREPDNVLVQAQFNQCEKFFLSYWFQVLSDVDGAFILKRLKEEVQQC